MCEISFFFWPFTQAETSRAHEQLESLEQWIEAQAELRSQATSGTAETRFPAVLLALVTDFYEMWADGEEILRPEQKKIIQEYRTAHAAIQSLGVTLLLVN